MGNLDFCFAEEEPQDDYAAELAGYFPFCLHLLKNMMQLIWLYYFHWHIMIFFIYLFWLLIENEQ